MKIGLIGINRYAKFLNFACNLHIFGFQQFLAQHGYPSTILNYEPVYHNGFNMREPLKSVQAQYDSAVARGVSADALARVKELLDGYRSVVEERKIRYDKFEQFIADHVRYTDEVYTSDSLELVDPGFDCYICVTDVIWKSLPTHDFDRGFLLGSQAFEGREKISYAASRGASQDFTPAQQELFARYLADIDAISVREQELADYIAEHTDRTATVVTDPVMLHPAEFWRELATDRADLPGADGKYLVLYYVMEQATDTIAKAVEYAKLHDLTIIELSDRPLKDGKVTDPSVRHLSRYDVGLDEFLGYLAHADAIFTNSFHGCCFGVLFEKALFVGQRNGPKIPNFLATFGLAHRQFAPNAKVTSLTAEIDYAPVRELLARERDHSGRFILDALAAAERRVAERAAAGTPIDHGPYDAARRALTYRVRFHSGTILEDQVHVDRSHPFATGVPAVDTGRAADAPEDADADDDQSAPEDTETAQSTPDTAQSTAQTTPDTAPTVDPTDPTCGIEIRRYPSKVTQYLSDDRRYVNDGTARIEPNRFRAPGFEFAGWTVRFRVDNGWMWLLADGTVAIGSVRGGEFGDRLAVLPDGGTLPHLPVNHISFVVLLAQWRALAGEHEPIHPTALEQWQAHEEPKRAAARAARKARQAAQTAAQVTQVAKQLVDPRARRGLGQRIARRLRRLITR